MRSYVFFIIISMSLYAKEQKLPPFPQEIKDKLIKKHGIEQVEDDSSINLGHSNPEISSPKIESPNLDKFKDVLTSKYSSKLNRKNIVNLSFVNNSGVSDDKIFIHIIGKDPVSKRLCFVKYDSQLLPSCVDFIEKIGLKEFWDFSYRFWGKNFVEVDISKNLSFFQKKQSKFTIPLPLIDEAKIYFSIQNPGDFKIIRQDEEQYFVVDPPFPDGNNDTLWDFREFENLNDHFFLSYYPQDFVVLPLTCSVFSKDFEIIQPSTTAYKIFSSFEQNVKNTQGFLDFIFGYSPWTSLQKNQIVLSPYAGTINSEFSNNHFIQIGWIRAFQDVFSKTSLKIDLDNILSISDGGGVWEGILDVHTMVFTFQRRVDQTHPVIEEVKLKFPSNSDEILTGVGDGWQAHTLVQKWMACFISYAINTNTLSKNANLGWKYFEASKEKLYKFNPELPTYLQFVNLYDYSLQKIFPVDMKPSLDKRTGFRIKKSELKDICIVLGSLKRP